MVLSNGMPAPTSQLELGRDGAELAPNALEGSTLAALEQVLAGPLVTHADLKSAGLLPFARGVDEPIVSDGELEL